jgi:hypothetical protein
MVFLSLPLFSKIEGNRTYVFPPFEKSSTVLALQQLYDNNYNYRLY